MSTETWHVIAIDVKISSYYLLLENQTLDECEDFEREWYLSPEPELVLVRWPALIAMPNCLSLLA